MSWGKFIISISLLSPLSSAFANVYLGLDLGVATNDDVIKLLKEKDAGFDSGYGYKGYSKNLPSIKVTSFDVFEKYGDLNESWLAFAPDNKLYSIYVSWNDSGKTFTLLKDTLDSKYGKPDVSGGGFEVKYRYTSGDIEVDLVRNTFGFNNDQKTSIEYIYEPELYSVIEMKANIDKEIKDNNARKASSDF